MNIVLCGDTRVYPGMELVIYSTLLHNKHINWYIFTMDIEVCDGGQITIYEGLTPTQRIKLERIVNYLDKSSNIAFLDSYQYYKDFLAGGPNDYTPFTPYAALRLILDKALPEVDDLLYLDCDTAVLGDISAMYYDCKSQTNENYFAVQGQARYSPMVDAISGVMFMNLKRMRDTGFLDTARTLFKNHLYEFPDQQAMQGAGSYKPLPDIYGYMWDLDAFEHDPKIIHFTNELELKIYSVEKSVPYFYKKYPLLQHIEKGLKLMDTINFKDGKEQKYNVH